jgi:hypothetical protein
VGKLYDLISRKAWTIMIWQILKLYLESRIRPEMLPEVPGVAVALSTLKDAIGPRSFAEINHPLFQTLPRFIPVASLAFNVNLSESQTRSLGINNPSSKQITYQASINGSPNFRLVQPRLTLSPNESSMFQVKYYAKSHRPEKATLCLIPEKPISMNEHRPKSARRSSANGATVKVEERPES